MANFNNAKPQLFLHQPNSWISRVSICHSRHAYLRLKIIGESGKAGSEGLGSRGLTPLFMFKHL